MASFDQIIENLSESDALVEALEKDIDKLQNDISERLEEKGVGQRELKKLFLKLQRKSKSIVKAESELADVLSTIESSSIDELEENLKSDQLKLESIRQYDEYFKNVESIYNNLKECKDKFEEKDFAESNHLLKRAFKLYESIQINSTNCDLADAYRIVAKTVKEDLDLMQEKFICDFIQIYKQNLFYDAETRKFYCEFVSGNLSGKYESFIECLLQEKSNYSVYFENTLRVLTEHFIRPILAESKHAILVALDGTESSVYKQDCCTIELRERKPEDVEILDDDAILENLKNFVKLTLQLLTVDFSISQSDNLIRFIGDQWTPQITSSLIKYFFESRLPKNESHFEIFARVLKKGTDVLEFMASMKMLELGEESGDVFHCYLTNVKDNFASKVSQDFLIRVKKCLKSDLSDMVSSDEAVESLKILKCKNRIPSLKISAFMVNLQEIFEEMAALIEISSSNLQLLLADAFSNVCELFVDICPFVFRVNIERDPRQNALFHNNCLYFAFLVESIVGTHKPLLDEMSTFLPAIRTQASQVFINQMQCQEKVLVSLIKNSTFEQSLQLIADEIPATDLKISSQSHFEFRSALNNCLKHLNTLHRAFDNILPEKICGRAFNTLISSFLNEFLQSIIDLDDISSLGAAHLCHELDYFSKELKQFLPNSEGLVSKWIKLNEINFILKSSMLEIVNRWADGNGVLANYLTADEVKHMIRALFQNNERRSNALAKIK